MGSGKGIPALCQDKRQVSHGRYGTCREVNVWSGGWEVQASCKSWGGSSQRMGVEL